MEQPIIAEDGTIPEVSIKDTAEVLTEVQKKKTSGPKPKKLLEQPIIAEDGTIPEVSIKDTAEVLPEVQKKKKSGPKPKKLLEQPIVTEESTDVTVEDTVTKVLTEVQKKKKSGPKSKKNQMNSAIDIDTHTGDNIKINKTHTHNDDVIIPHFEHAQLLTQHTHDSHDQELHDQELHDQELHEENFDQHFIDVTEVFIGDTLFYVDSHDNWFDLSHEPVLKPL